MKLQKTSIFGILMLVLLLNTIIGYFLPPTGILITPLIISVVIGLIMFTDNGFDIIEKSVLSYIFIGSNDIGVKRSRRPYLAWSWSMTRPLDRSDSTTGTSAGRIGGQTTFLIKVIFTVTIS